MSCRRQSFFVIEIQWSDRCVVEDIPVCWIKLDVNGISFGAIWKFFAGENYTVSSEACFQSSFGTIVALNLSGVAMLMVEQNALEALSVSARAYVLVQGRAEREGRAADVAADPTVRDLFLGGEARPMLAASTGGIT